MARLHGDIAPWRQRLALVFILLVFPCALSAVTLEEALAATLEKNPEIRAAKSQLEQAAGRRLVLRSIGFPDARINVPLGVQGGQRAGEDPVQPFAFGQGALTQAIFNAALPASFRRGNLELLIAQQRLNVAIVEQLHTARTAYATAAYQNSLRGLAEAQRERLQANARAQNDRYQAGEVDRQALSVARVLEQQATPQIEESRRVANGALLTLAQAMGENGGGVLPTIDAEVVFAPVAIDAEMEARAALDRRTDLKLARLLVRAGREDEQIAAAGYYPQIAATISGTYIPVTDIRRGGEGSARRSDDIISSEARAGVAYSWRVIDNGRVTGVVMRQRALREANEAVLAKLEADVSRELHRLQNNFASLRSRNDALAKGAAVAEETARNVQNSLVQGLASQLEYRSAESSSLQTRAALLAVAYEQQVALAERDRITGRYFQFSENASSVH
jgi:outer membrane protein TolC